MPLSAVPPDPDQLFSPPSLSPPLPPQPGNYERTVRRTDQSFHACKDIMACFNERAKVEKQYAQQLSEWGSKWKAIVDARK